MKSANKRGLSRAGIFGILALIIGILIFAAVLFSSGSMGGYADKNSRSTEEGMENSGAEYGEDNTLEIPGEEESGKEIPGEQDGESGNPDKGNTEESMETGNEESENADDYIPDSAHEIIITTDIHILAESLTDNGAGFQSMIEHGDGRAVQYCNEICSAWADEIIEESPELVILSGDLSFNGEAESHEALASILSDIESEGIEVIVIPGNHDMNNPAAASFQGDIREPAKGTSPEIFRQIYRDFGYKGAESYDTASLSYVWQFGEHTRIFMLDDNIYEPEALVGGHIKEDTYYWLDDELQRAYEDGMQIISVSHHNVLDESEVYTENCTIEHSEKLIELLELYETAVHLSGHLHVQHYMQSSYNEWNFNEIVTGSLTTPPCNYGVLKINDAGEYSYRTRNVDMRAWALKNHIDNDDLSDWEEFKEEFLKRVFKNQAYAEIERLGIDELSASDRDLMSDMYAQLGAEYYSGKAYLIAEEIENSRAYELWTNIGYSSSFIDNISFIIRDGVRDYNKIDSK